MKYAITLIKTIVVHVDAADDVDAREWALNEGTDLAEADGDWRRATPEIKEVSAQ